MYEKHESYGVLKLSKQALKKGNFGEILIFFNIMFYNWPRWPQNVHFET